MHTRRRLLESALAAAIPDLVEQGPRHAAASGLLAGASRVDIAPPPGIVHLNWGAQTHVAAEGLDPAGLYARALVISGGRQKFAMVDIDTLRVDGFEEAIGEAAARLGVPAAHVRLAASHTHAGPNFSAVRGPLGADLSAYKPAYEAYRKRLGGKLVEAVVEAGARLRPVHVYGGRGTGSININRRVRAAQGRPASVGTNPEGFVDPELVVVRVDTAEGRPLAILANYACHGTVMGHENKLVSPDWIGTARNTVEAALPGATCLFFQGAAGDQGPVEGFTGDLAVAHRLGALLGHQIAALALGIDTVRREPRFEGFIESTAFIARQPWRVRGPREATLRFASRLIQLPPRTYSREEIASMEEAAAGAEKRLEEVRGAGDAWRLYQAQARLRRLRDLLAQWKRPPGAAHRQLSARILRIGQVAVVAVPGEPFGEIGLAVKRASPFPVTMFCGYSDGIGGDYIPVASEYPHGGYEIERTPYGTGAAEKLIRELIEMYEAVR